MGTAYFLTDSLLETALKGEGGATKTLESQTAQEMADKTLKALQPLEDTEERSTTSKERTSTEILLITSESLGADHPSFVQYTQSFGQNLENIDNGSLLVGSFETYQPIPSPDGTTHMYRINIYPSDGDRIEALIDSASSLSNEDFQAFVFGDSSINWTFSHLAERDLLVGESIGIGVALIILALVFGAVIAGLIPLILALVSVFTTIGLVSIVGQILELNEFVPNIVTMMGLAVGIDYSLFVLSRYNEERGKGLNKLDAIRSTGATANRAIFFSGGTVVLALTGMLITPERFFQAFGTGAILVVFVAVIACLTLLPALISILGDRVNSVGVPKLFVTLLFIIGVYAIPDRTEAFRIMIVAATVISLLISKSILLSIWKVIRHSRDQSKNMENNLVEHHRPTRPGFWDRSTKLVMRIPIVSMLISVAILGALIIPFADLQKGTSGISVLPDQEHTKQAFELLNEKYGFGSDQPAIVVIEADIQSTEIMESLDSLQDLINNYPGLQPPTLLISPDNTIAIINAAIPGDPFSQPALNTIRHLRTVLIPRAFADLESSEYVAFVGGASAETVDSVDLTDEYTPWVFTAVLGLSFCLLLIAFRSIVIPIASILMNLLSVGAAYGLVVLVFQKGFLIDIFGFQQVEQVEFWLPLFMFSILFGLSMDYHVFMLSRIKEHYDETGDHGESVAFGLRTTARIITGAALIMVAVFGGFALGQISFFQSMGFGLGAAILLDATIVRSLLVPSVLKLLGKSTWYYPKALNWIPNISIEGTSFTDHQDNSQNT